LFANPSSYAYLDAERPDVEEKALRQFGDARNCTTYDNWPYGLKRRTGYASKLGDEELREAIRVTAGDLPAGATRYACLSPVLIRPAPRWHRAPAAWLAARPLQNYVNSKYSAKHRVLVVPLCGHNARCMFTAEPVLPILFPKP